MYFIWACIDIIYEEGRINSFDLLIYLLLMFACGEFLSIYSVYFLFSIHRQDFSQSDDDNDELTSIDTMVSGFSSHR